MTDSALDILPSHYSKLYRSEKHDSPDKSRTTLIRRMVGVLKEGVSNNNILNIGSGPQSLEKQLLTRNDSKSFDKYNFITIDIAQIEYVNLLSKRKGNVFHTRGSGLQLPYADNSFGVVVSNHAIDFLPKEAFQEAYRVLVPGGTAIFNFHHPTMIPENLDTVNDKNVRDFWGYLVKNKVLFDSGERIEKTMSNIGFTVNEVDLNKDSNDTWWEVRLTK